MHEHFCQITLFFKNRIENTEFATLQYDDWLTKYFRSGKYLNKSETSYWLTAVTSREQTFPIGQSNSGETKEREDIQEVSPSRITIHSPVLANR